MLAVTERAAPLSVAAGVTVSPATVAALAYRLATVPTGATGRAGPSDELAAGSRVRRLALGPGRRGATGSVYVGR